MKKLLLTSAIVAAAGAASAEVTWTGDAEFGFRTYMEDPFDGTWVPTNGTLSNGEAIVGNGLYVDAGLDAKAAAELDNGIAASIEYGMNFDYAAEGEAGFVTLDNFPTLIFESSVGKMTVGDVDHAAHALFEGNDAMDVEFTENDKELVARVDTMLSSFTLGGSYTVTSTKYDPDTGLEVPYGKADGSDIGLPAGSMTAALKGEMMGGKVSAGYQTNEDTGVDTYGVSLGYGWNGISGVLAYTADSNEQSSVGFTAGYTMQNGLKLEAGYANNGASTGYGLDIGFVAMGADIGLGYWIKDDDTEIKADVAYTIESAGVTVKAGYNSMKDNVIDGGTGAYWAGAEYALGGGASLFGSYSLGDELGDAEYKPGATVGVKLSF